MATTTTMPTAMISDGESIMIAAVEGGGTSFVVAVAELSTTTTTRANQDDAQLLLPQIVHRTSIDSSHDNPQQTLDECAKFLLQHRPSNGYHSLGVACFGPIGLNKSNKTSYGCILGTSPKQQWRNVNILQPLVDACQGNNNQLVVSIETDVNAPALSEYLLEVSKKDKKQDQGGISSLAYITVGTGIGVGLVVNGQPVHGRMHPEGGHVVIKPLSNDQYEGYSWGTERSPYQGRHTVEGMGSSVALTERLQMMTGTKTNLSRDSLAELEDDHEIWHHAANALANLCVTLLLTLSVEKIVLGGGVMKRQGLLEKIQSKTIELLNGYLDLPQDMTSLITTSSYGSDAGLVGALTLAQRSYYDQAGITDKSSSTNNGVSPFTVGFIHGIAVGVIILFVGLMSSSSRPSPRR